MTSNNLFLSKHRVEQIQWVYGMSSKVIQSQKFLYFLHQYTFIAVERNFVCVSDESMIFYNMLK